MQGDIHQILAELDHGGAAIFTEFGQTNVFTGIEEVLAHLAGIAPQALGLLRLEHQVIERHAPRLGLNRQLARLGQESLKVARLLLDLLPLLENLMKSGKTFAEQRKQPIHFEVGKI